MRGTKTALLVTLLLLVITAACRSLPEGTAGAELRHGDLGVTVAGYELRYLDLESETGAVVTTESPVLLIRLSVTNYGGAAARYDTRDSATSGQQSLTPLLFVDPGGDGEWRTQGNNVPMVALGQLHYIDDPVTQLVTIGAGETIQDVLLFQPPPEGTSALVLSLPPTVFGADVELPAVIRIPYGAPEPVGPPVYSLGEEAPGRGFVLRVTGSEIAYWPNPDRTGFTERPLLGVHYAVRNTSEGPLRYDPPHRDQLGDGAPSLSDGRRQYARVAPPSQRRIEGQLVEPETLAAGQTLSDLLLFERPDASVTSLVLHFPGGVLGQPGKVRVRFPYTYSDPPLPAELTEPQNSPEPEPEPEGGAGESPG